jgi:hypothetical protein
VKLQCDLCREIVSADFAVTDGGSTASIEVHCPACAGTFTVAATRDVAARPPAPRRAPAADEPAMTCPKCGDEQPRAPACRSCGLMADRMPAFALDRDAGAPPDVVAAWDAVEVGWDDDAAHDRFLERVAAVPAYPWAAQRYREAARLRPGDRRATDRLVRLARMAEATLLSTAAGTPPTAPRPYRGAIAVLVAMVLVVLVGFGFAVLATDLRDEPPARTAPDKPEGRRKP